MNPCQTVLGFMKEESCGTCVRCVIESVGFFSDNERLTVPIILSLYLHLARRVVNGLCVILRDLSRRVLYFHQYAHFVLHNDLRFLFGEHSLNTYWE